MPASLIRRFVPARWLDAARALRDRARKSRRRAALQRSTAVTRASLAADLRAMGLQEGDTLLVHSALSSLGWVEGGSEAVLGALTDVLGTRGTLLIPIFPLDRSAKEWLDADPIYDPRTTPSRLGALTEAFRTRTGVVFGDHATHPIAGLGPRASALLAAHGESVSPFGPKTAFALLARDGGRILALGSGIAHVTSLHLVEEEHPAFPVDVFLPGTTPARVMRSDGSIVLRPVRVMNPEVARRRLESRPAWALRIRDELVRRGAATEHPAGQGTAWMIDASRLEESLLAMADEGITIYEP